MSNHQRADAYLTIDGVRLDGPYFPDELRGLAYEEVNGGHSREDIIKRSKAIPGFLSCGRMTTSDGYDWFAATTFQFGRLWWRKTIVVLFPWAFDGKLRDGTTADRSKAVYTKGAVNQELIKSTLNSLRAALKN